MTQRIRIGSVDIELWSIPGVTGSGPPAVDTERMIEVPLGLWFRKTFGPAILEMGAVLPYYTGTTEHTVVDPYDPWPGCIKKTAAEVDYRGSFLLSISTIEHLGQGEYGQPYNPVGAVDILLRMMTARRALITWAAGYHKVLDDFAEAALVKVIKLHRVRYSEWAIVDSLKEVKYESPFPYGNGIYVATTCDELLYS